MAIRAASPARSETEFDIGDNLLGDDNSENDSSDEAEKFGAKEAAGGFQGVRNQTLNLLQDVSSDDDETAIAQQLAASNRKSSNLKGRTVKKGGGFQVMGLSANLLKAITRKGFSVPTPIQRKTIPLLLNDKDVVGMARTGSGKTAAFIIPMIEKLKAHHSQVGARSLVLSPSRELALQTLQVVKELGRGTDLKATLLVGGDSLEDQFAAIASNPDIIIATPGRFVHLQVEMSLDLSSIRYVVFDEADRLFEMGFAAQLTEILHALPSARQTLLFSATLPKSLVEFARAGLQDPVLVRLDADSKISPDLQSAFFTVKSAEKEGALLHLLQDVMHIPTGSQLASSADSQSASTTSKKRKRPGTDNAESKDKSNPYSTIIFAATKHHVDYLAYLLKLAGYAVSHVYGSLDQTARKMQVQAFRNGQTNILVVTDVAARGIDIPILANVVNYDFPSQPKIYVHRVGRTARAGQKGWSYSIIHDADAPYLIDLQLFLGRKLTVGRTKTANVNFAEEVVVGSLQRDNMQAGCEWVSTKLNTDADLAALRSVAMKGGKLYQRTRNSASAESAKRSKDLLSSNQWTELHPLFNDDSNNLEAERERMLARVSGFRPQESVFEIGARRNGRKGNEEAIEAMHKIRSGLEVKRQKAKAKAATRQIATGTVRNEASDDEDMISEVDENMQEASDAELEVTFTGNQNAMGHSKKQKSNGDGSFRDTENFMSYTPSNYNFHEDQGYGVQSGTNANFTEAARNATMDLNGDELGKNFGEARGVMRWDKRHKKYVSRANDEDGSKGKRLVRGESGAKIAASFRSGRYDAWKKANKITRTPRVGEVEHSADAAGSRLGQRFRHKSMKAPKAADKFRDDYDKKKKKFAEQKQKERESGMNGKKELRSVDDIRKQRNMKDKRREKNARPSKKTKR